MRRLIPLGVCSILLLGAGGCSSTGVTVSTPKRGYTFQGRLRFFASGKTAPPIKQRIYGTSFPASTTRFVHSEIKLTNHEYGRADQWVHIERKYYRPDGTLLRVVSGRDRIPKSWQVSNSNGGVGWATSGRWKPGRYQVVVYLDGRRAASGSFRIYGSAPAPRPRPIASARGYTLKSLKVFEGPYTAPAYRSYQTTFRTATARYLFWEVSLENRRRYQGDQRIRLQADYYRGSVKLVTSTYHATLKSAWASGSFHKGYGRATPGWWTPGSYKVKVFADGRYLATRYFTVTGSTPPARPKPPAANDTTKIHVYYPRAAVGRHYSVKPTYTSNFVKTPRWKIIEKALPPGLSLNSLTGYVTGYPKRVGSWSFSLGLRDRWKGTSKQPPGATWYYVKKCTIQVGRAAAKPRTAFPAPTRLGRTRYTGSEWTIQNSTSWTLTIHYSGPRIGTVTLGPQGSRILRIPSGSYTVSATLSKPGVRPYAGSVTLARGYRYRNSFYIQSTPARPTPRPIRPAPRATPRPTPKPAEPYGERSTEGG